MTDWRQIQARVRKARSSADPPGQLAALFERTHDAMVAFELAQIHEKSGAYAEAARWYTAAAERFRRAQWKQKAEEALARLGSSVAVAPPAISEPETSAPPVIEQEPVIQFDSVIAEITVGQVPETTAESDGGQQETVEHPAAEAAPPTVAAPTGTVPGHRRKRRGRRGGRGRSKARRMGAPVAVTPAPVPFSQPLLKPASDARPEPVVPPSASEEFAERQPSQPEPVSDFEAAAAVPSLQMRTRAGGPALSSRMTQLESQLRRLLASPLRPVDQPEDAPAGPGVFLISDTDETCYYYIEACQTLRVGIGNLIRSGRGGREGANVKERLAEHLGINEARVGKYLKEHCVVRWLQLDEGAPFLAHFATAVLHPVANE
jgi:hypothetical protein